MRPRHASVGDSPAGGRSLKRRAQAEAEQTLGGVDDLGVERAGLERDVLAQAVGDDPQRREATIRVCRWRG